MTDYVKVTIEIPETVVVTAFIATVVLTLILAVLVANLPVWKTAPSLPAEMRIERGGGGQ